MWTRWPDYERVAWVNYAIKVLWPHCNKAITQQVLMVLGPKLKDTVLRVGVLEALDVECFDLGDRPIRIGGIKVYETNEDEVIIEAPILWGSNSTIRIAARVRLAGVVVYIPIEVGDIVLKAESRITIKPLVETLPCLGAVTVSLLKEPFVDLSVMVINRLDLMALPVVRDIAQRTVKNVVGDMLVFPNQMSFDIMENGGRAPEPEGMLTIKVLRGSNLRSPGELFTKSDPFVVVEVREGRPVVSSTKSNTSEPVWEEEFHLIVDDRKTQALTLTVKDDDFGWQDKTIGRVRVPLEGMPFMDHPLASYELTLSLDKGRSSGKGKAKPDAPPAAADPRPGHGVARMRVKTIDGWDDVPFPNSASGSEAPEEAAAPSPPAASRSPAVKKDKHSDRGELVVELLFHPFNREAMAAKTETAEAQHPQGPSRLAHARSSRRDYSLKVARGVLTVTLTRCINLQGDGHSDPQVVISLYDQTAKEPIVQKSSVVYNEQSPRWGDKFDFVGISADSFVVFNVKDHAEKDKNGDKKSLGKLRIPVPDVVRNLRIKDVWALQETQQGEIALTLEWKALAFGDKEEHAGEPVQL
mmetsp:Transcript_9432/g.22710  ORF Transcript_9432/g.22710 Transcript_9432/m.22710 type:complete len:583 (-) Transcript_9432:189-1937(-)